MNIKGQLHAPAVLYRGKAPPDMRQDGRQTLRSECGREENNPASGGELEP
jgi:hypothetical protein